MSPSRPGTNWKSDCPSATSLRAECRKPEGEVQSSGTNRGSAYDDATARQATRISRMGNSDENNPIPSIHGFHTALLKNRAFILSPVISVYPIRVIRG